MPPVQARKFKEREELHKRIEHHGIEMSPCSYCLKHNKKCIVSDSSTRCGECARFGKKCDVAGPSAAEWQALEREEKRLQTEKEEAFASLAASMAKLQRVEKTQRLLKTRAGEMLRRGLKTMDELDAAEEAERASAPALVSPSGSPLDPPDDLFSLEAYEHLFGFSDGTLLGASGS